MAAAFAAWYVPALHGLDPWRGDLPHGTGIGAFPDQDQADRWASERTLGLITRFPLTTTTADTLILLASALATRVGWLQPIDTTQAGELGGRWASTLTRVLHSPTAPGHHTAFTSTRAAGLVAITAGWDVTELGARVLRADGLTRRCAQGAPADGPPAVRIYNEALTGDTTFVGTFTTKQAAGRFSATSYSGALVQLTDSAGHKFTLDLATHAFAR